MYVCTLLTSYVSQFEMNRLTNTQMKQRNGSILWLFTRNTSEESHSLNLNKFVISILMKQKNNIRAKYVNFEIKN